ncbi:MAG TPA: tetratricopeptide repeat protein, partial [Candidatus Polarisedimenticolia bacterium]|nr:tetratricopeptide repeat protein [Candidatus Polarisedimenticolia bacterium]
LKTNAEAATGSREAAEKALALDPDYALAHGLLGWGAMTYDNDLAAAARHYEHALALAPADPDLLRNAAVLLRNLGRLDDAIALMETVVARDPLSVTTHFNLGICRISAKRFDAAMDSYRTVLNLSPGRGGAHYGLGLALLLKGDAAGARAEMQQETSEPHRMQGLPIADFALGRKAASDQGLAAFIAKYEKDWSYNIATMYAFRGEDDRAFEWLDKALRYADPGLIDSVTDRLLDPIRSDPRWLPLLRRIGRAPEQLAGIRFKPTPPAAAPGR